MNQLHSPSPETVQAAVYDLIADEAADEDDLVGDDPSDMTPRERRRAVFRETLKHLEKLAHSLPKLNRADQMAAVKLFEDAEKTACELSLATFYKCAWSALDPSEYKHNWHISVTAEWAEKLITGEMRRLIVNQPPRSGKSNLLSVALPLWIWIQSKKGPMSGAHVKFLTASYGQSLSLKHAGDMRKVINSPWFQKHWGHRFRLLDDRNAVGFFENDRGGYRMATSVGAGLTGQGADCVREGTIVSTPDGGKCVEDIRVGDIVYGYEHNTNSIKPARVLALAERRERLSYVIDTYEGLSVECTGNHEIFVTDKGYTQAEMLSRRDTVLTAAGEQSVENIICCEDGEKRFFDIQVEGYQNFFANGILVHNCMIIDDPANTQDVTSEAERASVVNWYSQSLSTRLNDSKTGVILLVMQRQHESDLTGFILNTEPEMWEHLVLRMRYESNPFLDYDPRGYDEDGDILEDPSLAEGTLLWPDRVPEIEVQKLEKTLGSYGASGQLQQRPEPKGGGIIRVEHWKMFPPVEQAEEWKKDGILCWPPLEFIVASCDLAFTERQENDYSAMTMWGVWHDRTGAPKVIVMHAWQDRLSFNPLITRIGNNCRKFKPDVLLIEAKAAGISAAQEIQRVYGAAEWSTVLVNPKGDKVSRAISIQGLFEEGLIYAPDRIWAQMLIDTCASFPKGQHDDLVDSTTQALRWMRDNGVIKRKDEYKRDVFDSLPRPGDANLDLPPYDV